MNKVDAQYLALLEDILENGYWRNARNGRTLTVLGRTFRHNMREGFPLLTTKKMFFKGIRTELEWFLNGSTNIQPLVKQGNYIWVGDAYKNYLNKVMEDDGVYSPEMPTPFSEKEFIEKIKNDDEFAEIWGELGPIYGKQWRKWEHIDITFKSKEDEDGVTIVNGKRTYVDQIQKAIDTLNHNPDSRKIRVSAWNIGELDDMLLEPCHYGFTLSTRELTEDEKKEYGKERGLSLIWNQRSVDTPLGLPFNIASYALLLLMIADEVQMLPLELIGHLEDVHIYENQMEGVTEQLKRSGYSQLPTVHVRDGIYSRGDGDIILENYRSDDKINFPLSN